MSNIPGSGSKIIRKTLLELLKLNEYYPPEKGIMLMVSIMEQPIADMTTEEINETLNGYEELTGTEYTEGWKVKLIEELEKRNHE